MRNIKDIRITEADFKTEAEANTAFLTFSTGETVALNFHPLIEKHDSLSAILDPVVFATGPTIDAGIAIGWDAGIDMDAEALLRIAQIQSGRSIGPDNFRAWRKSRGLTQKACGAVLGITGRTIQLYESGEQPVPLSITLVHRLNQKVQAFG